MPRFSPLPLKDIAIDDPFWSARIATARDTSIDYMWRALNDEIEGVAPSRCLANFRIACGQEEGEFYGYRFQDSDLYKWLEAVAYALESKPDAALQERAEGAIALIEGAQQPNGYLNNHVTLKKLRAWSDTMTGHEMYCAGHLFEAAAAWKNATGQDRLLKVACRFANHIGEVFGPNAGQKRGYPGHQEIELGLFKLWQATKERKYLELAKYFLDERGAQPYYYDLEQSERTARGEAPIKYFREHGPAPYSYQQAHAPVREQEHAIGHAVRVVYMLSGMIDVGGQTDDSLLAAAERLYRDIVGTQMYITGGIGSMGDGEAFSFPYDLPNDTMYNETCASIGLMMVCRRLLGQSGRAEYADVLERALYNTVLAGVSLGGDKFFYVNPMEVWPERSEKRHESRGIHAERQGWYGCACCPPNVLRTLLGLGQYIYGAGQDRLNIALYINSTARFKANGTPFALRQSGDYLGKGEVEIEITEGSGTFTLGLRLPDWCDRPVLRVNGAQADISQTTRDGFALLEREWTAGDRVCLSLPMRAQFVRCDGRVPYNAGKAALRRGPLVYCAEQADNGEMLWNLLVDTARGAQPYAHELIREPALTAAGMRQRICGEPLYTADRPSFERTDIRYVPYYCWGNRGKGEMAVWLREAHVN